MKVGIGVARKGKWRETGLTYCYRKLFAQFPDQGVFRSLTIFHLAAGKFPETGHWLALRSLRDQHASVRIDERASRNEDDLRDQGTPYER